jgi:hypothetical protein
LLSTAKAKQRNKPRGMSRIAEKMTLSLSKRSRELVEIAVMCGRLSDSDRKALSAQVDSRP